MSDYEFTNSWFDYVRPIWDHLIPPKGPSKILEIGSYEGASTCHLIDLLAKDRDIELHCIDTWDGGVEHKDMKVDMTAVEARFKRNIDISMAKWPNKVNLTLHKTTSDMALPRMLSSGYKNYFDLIYVDGSHQAPDVLFDLVVGFNMLRTGGLMIMDDYIWVERWLANGVDLLRCPKPAIDAFVNINIRRVNILPYHLWQLYVEKLSD